MRFFRLLTLLVLLLAPLIAHAQREKLSPEDLEVVQKNWPAAKRTATGLRTIILEPGTGQVPKAGEVVKVLYTGKLLNGTIFDEANDPAKPFTFRIGRGNVIDGWEEGLQLMKVGEKRLLIVPYELGYGTRGQPPKIPKWATLVFEVQLLGVEK